MDQEIFVAGTTSFMDEEEFKISQPGPVSTQRELQIQIQNAIDMVLELQKERAEKLKTNVSGLFQKFRRDSILEAMFDDPNTYKFGVQRMTEIC